MTLINPDWTDREKTPIDFIVVGAGAGGAPLAARLAERGFQVLVVEMGPKKPASLPGAVVENTEVPLLHAETTEDKRHSLRFFVDHFGGENEERNPRRHQPTPAEFEAVHPQDEHGVFYPRAQGVGGCTIHNAMITICGPSEDWDEIAEDTQDSSWRGERMRSYFERLERCNYDRPTWWSRLKGWWLSSGTWENGRHGHDGWLETSMSDLRLLADEKQFFKVVASATLASLDAGIDSLAEIKSGSFPGLDPNHWETMRLSQEGLSQIPCAITSVGERSSPRERLLESQQRYPEWLHTLTGVLVTRLIFTGEAPASSQSETGSEDSSDSPPQSAEPTRVCGVEVLPQAHVYEADAQATEPNADWESQLQNLYCRREVILCGGSFNTPQLLMLSGLGPREHLQGLGITVRHDLAAVGQHLQDRYEVPLVATISDRFKLLDPIQLTSQRDDPQLRQWRERRGLPPRTSVYATNGGLIGVFKRSSVERRVPDLFMFAAAGYFPGYHVGWSRPSALAPEVDGSGQQEGAAAEKRTLTWLVLKARSRNDQGTVELRTASPFRRPKINFNVLPGELDQNEDVQAIFEGVHFIEQMLANSIKKGIVEKYEFPYADPQLTNGDLNDRERKQRVKRWIKDVAWGHHACGTCRLGTDPNRSVVNQRFQVHHVRGLRIADASIFPRIPGYFIVTNVYMVAEKAADVISEDHADHFARAEIANHAAIKENLRRAPILYSSRTASERIGYPEQMEVREAELIRQRRKVAGCE